VLTRPRDRGFEETMSAFRLTLPDHLREPHPRRLDPQCPDYTDILRLHEQALAARADFYRDPRTGYDVFTAQALWERGFCCGGECRHCPFPDRER
jgi:hypothetical protein